MTHLGRPHQRLVTGKVGNCCHGNHYCRLWVSPKAYGDRYITLVQYCNELKYTLPETSCHLLWTCTVAMAMVMVDYTCVQFCYHAPYYEPRIVQTSNELVVVYKHVHITVGIV